MESVETIQPLKDGETYSFPKKRWAEGEYGVDITKAQEHSSVDFVFDEY
jgi:hypothetical protein